MATYYVDATGGNDAWPGTEAQPWQTIAKVNGEAFNAGDSVLFKRGEMWVGTALTVTWSGAVGNPITFGAYDAGANPTIDGNDLANCITAANQSYLRFENIEAAQGLDSGFQFTTCTYVEVVDCDAHDCGNDNLIFITASHHCMVLGGSFYNGYERVPGTIISGIEVADGSYDIQIFGAICRDNAGTLATGITVHSHVATNMPYNITIDGCACYGNADYGIQILKQDNTADAARNIEVRNCVSYNNLQDGVRVYKSAGAIAYPNGVVVERCYCYGNTTYAYFFQGDNLSIRRNVFRGRGLINASTATGFFNNTMYFETGLGLYPCYITNARTNNVEVKNNVTYRTVAGGMAIGVDATVPAVGGVDVNYNLYYSSAEGVLANRWHWRGVSQSWANWLLNSGQDANSIAPADPLFINAAGENFKLQHGSPVLGVGVDVGLPYRGAAPDYGRWEAKWLSQQAHAIYHPVYRGI